MFLFSATMSVNFNCASSSNHDLRFDQLYQSGNNILYNVSTGRFTFAGKKRYMILSQANLQIAWWNETGKVPIWESSGGSNEGATATAVFVFRPSNQTVLHPTCTSTTTNAYSTGVFVVEF